MLYNTQDADSGDQARRLAAHKLVGGTYDGPSQRP